MNNKRRNFLVLLLVAGLLAASLVVIFTKPTRLGLDLKGGVSLVYQALPTKQSKVTGEAIDRSIEIMRERVDKLGVAEPEILRSGADQIIVNLPDVQNVTQAENQVGTVAKLYFYDWETNVIGPDGKTDPTNANVTGGPSAGSVGAIPFYDAVQRAAKQPKAEYPKASFPNGSYFLVNSKPVTVTLASGKTKRYPARSVIAGPEKSSAALFTGFKDDKQPAGTNVTFVKPGTVVIAGEQTGKNNDGPPAGYYVLRDNPVLEGTDINDPKQGFDSQAGGSGDPKAFQPAGFGTWVCAAKGRVDGSVG